MVNFHWLSLPLSSLSSSWTPWTAHCQDNRDDSVKWKTRSNKKNDNNNTKGAFLLLLIKWNLNCERREERRLNNENEEEKWQKWWEKKRERNEEDGQSCKTRQWMRENEWARWWKMEKGKFSLYLTEQSFWWVYTHLSIHVNALLCNLTKHSLTFN